MLARIPNTYDVAILGSGFGGSILAAILARNGASVLVIDAKSHPRFAIGESTIPQTSQLLSLLARDYDVPELANIGLGSPDGIRKNVGDVCGIKRTFGFAYHKLGQEYDPAHGIQFGNTWRDENHLFRQDIDAYLSRVALSYGAILLQDTTVTEVETNEETGVLLRTKAGDEFKANYLVDGSGFRSLLAHKYDLREKPTRFQHHSRSMFTHMIDVKPFEECVDNPLSNKWSQSTLHHVFERGWLWVIPFNNYEGSKNPIVSVGLTVDPRAYPGPSGDAQAEFNEFLKKLPSAERQFENAKLVRPWVNAGRIQYSSKQCVGPRYCLMAHATGFIDPLFSRGLINTVETIGALAKALLPAIEEKDYSFERFSHIGDLQDSILDYADRLANGSFISWSDFEVWNAWLRVWAVGTGVAESNLGSYMVKGKGYEWPAPPKPIFSPFEDHGYRKYFEDTEAAVLQYEAGKTTAQETAEKMWAILNGYAFKMPLRNGSSSQEWAIKNSTSRDLFMGAENLHERWSHQEPDPHLTGKVPVNG